jgi:MFS family permease
MMRELAWSNVRISVLAATYTIGNLASNPLVGIALDRFGARIVLLLGAAAFAAGLLCASGSHSLMSLAACFGLVGVGMSGFSLPSAVVITRSVPAQKGLGMGIFMGAASVGAVVFLSVVAAWIQAVGWRHALARLAALSVVLLPVMWLSLRGDENSTGIRSAARVTTQESGSEVFSQLLNAGFLVAALCGMLFTIGLLAIYYDVVDLLGRAGYSPHIAALAFGGTWLVSGAGSLVIGHLADRFAPARVLAAVILISAVGILFLYGAPAPRYGAVCLVAFILLWGASGNVFSQLIPAVLVERFGSRHLGTILGAQFAASGVAGSLAPMLTGLLVDRSGSYDLAIAVSVSATVLSAALALAIGAIGSPCPLESARP